MTTMPGRLQLWALLSHADRLAHLDAMRRERAAIDAAEAELLSVIETDADPYADGTDEMIAKDFVREDVACSMKVTSKRADELLATSARLAQHFPSTMQAMRDGQLPGHYARRLADDTANLPAAVLPTLERSILVKAGAQTFSQFTRSLGRAVAVVDTRRAEIRHEQGRAERRIHFGPPDANGMTELWALLPSDDAARLKSRVEAMAAAWKRDDDRTADQRRADALCALADGGILNAARVNVNVTVSLSTLLGLDEQPGELDDQSIPAALARALAHEQGATWRRIVHDPVGNVCDVASRSYVPPAAMTRLIRLRDRRCVFPTCSRPAECCETDHTRDWAKGGTTCPANLMPLCSRHHHLKHDGGWSLKRLDDGSVRWTSPTNGTYDKPPPDPLPRDMTIESRSDPPPF